MSVNNKSDMSTSGSDGPLFSSGPRGAAFLERPGRESIANRIQSSALGTSRSAATSAHADPVGFVQSIISEVKAVIPDQKVSRSCQMQRIVGSIVGNSSTEESKRLKVQVDDGTNMARVRTKTLGGVMSKLDKELNPRKRPHGDLSSNGGVGGPSSGRGVSRSGQKSHSLNADESEMGPPKAERTKSSGQNRRARTSIAEMDTRNLGATRSSASIDKTRDVSKITSRSSGEEKAQELAANNSWEKPKLKKKRSVIKTDASTSVGPARSLDRDRERKQEAPPRLGGDGRAKVTGPSSSRYGISIAAGGISGKLDPEQGGLESPRPLPRGSQDGGVLALNKRERMGGFEIGNHKAINKLTDQEGSPTTSVSRANTSIRGPRSTPAAVPKASAGMSRAPPDSDEWDRPSPSNKSGSSAGGASSSKRAKSALSPSPPVGPQWASQRPPKTRVPRRSNIAPIGSQGGGLQVPDSVENNTMAMPSQRTHHVKKGDHAQSSSEESGSVVHKPKDNKRKRTVEAEENNGLIQRKGTAGHPLKKNKLVVEDDIGDVAVRKNGRGGRGFAPPRPGRPTSVEKPEASGTTTKQRSVRSSSEGRPGRPPVKKFSERKSNNRAREAAMDSPLDITGQPEDDREELLAAANAAFAPGYDASKDILWKQNEGYFRFIADEDMSFLIKEVTLLEEQSCSRKADELDRSKKGNLDYVSLPSTPNGHGPFSNGEATGIVAWQNDAVEPILEQLVRGMNTGSGAGSDIRSFTSFSICQKLMSAIISEEELERIECSNGHDSNILCLELEEGWLAHQESEMNQPRNGVQLDVMSPDCPYEQMSINDRILLELNQIGIYPDPCEHVPDLTLTDEDDINDELATLEAKLSQQAFGRRAALLRAEQKARAAKETQEREFSHLAFDKLVLTANEKYLTSRGKHGSRAARQSAMGFVNRTLARCKEFESNGTSCFDELSFKELLVNSLSKQSDPTCEDKSPQEPLDKDEQWSAGVKKKELLLDDVVGNITGSVSLGSGAKGKRSERDARGNNKNSRGSSSIPKGDRKPKAKPKQRNTSASTLSNGAAELAPRPNDRKREGLPPLPTKSGSKQMEKEREEELEPLPDLSGLQLPDIDLVGDTTGNGQDLTSWLTMDDGLQEVDCIGLDIPLDDLGGLNFMM
ncbi:hypothetical protein LUZ61_016775 [Rhynchospora tenuis]|uniref:Uncharacterized protein n=1 Tax=Rhynchospora tenuis TaxID=198213 RepID=A0AAD5Z671_9POAL|nr:hypothetical protein LUZ61_016775 [Rhynchospora tenuis]